MLFDAIFLTLFFLAWVVMGGLPWLLWSVRRRAFGAIWALPFALLGGAGGGVLVPVLGLDNGVGVGLSLATAVAGGALLTWAAYAAWDTYDLARRFQRWRLGQPRPSDALGLIVSAPRPPKRADGRSVGASGQATASIDSEPSQQNDRIS